MTAFGKVGVEGSKLKSKSLTVKESKGQNNRKASERNIFIAHHGSGGWFFGFTVNGYFWSSLSGGGGASGSGFGA